MIGLVVGIYFSDEIVSYITEWKMRASPYQFTKHVIGISAAIAFFISAPAIFLGAAIAIGIKQLFIGQSADSGTKT